MLSMRIVHAGEGYAYLMNSVATHDDTSAPEMSLGDYYNANGTPPGRWFGQGLKGLGETTAIAGTVVVDEQMAALYGEGMHPDADAMIDDGAELKDVQLGRTYPYFTGNDPVLEAVKKAEKSFRLEHGRRADSEERNRMAFKIAAPFYLEETGAIEAPERDVLAWLNEKKNRVKQPTSGVDLTFSPAKSVSLVWALGDDDTRQTIEKIHQQAVEDTLKEVEEEFLFTRTGARSERVIKARGMIASTFMHYDTRAGDPDLHTHCLISNKVQAARGQQGLDDDQADKWRSLDARYLLKNSARIGQRYQVKMAQALGQELDLEFYERDSDEGKAPVWEVAGIDEELINSASQRRAGARPVYEEYAEKYRTTHGHYPDMRTRNKLWQAAILETRDAKKPARSLAEHREEWLELFGNGQQLDLDSLRQRGKAYASRSAFPVDSSSDEYVFAIAELAEKAVEDTRQRRAEFNIRHLETSVSMHLTNWKFDNETHSDHVRQEVLEYAKKHLLTELGVVDSSHLPAALVREDGQLITAEHDGITYAAHATLEEEHKVLASLNELTGYTISDEAVDQALQRNVEKHGFALNDGQAKMAHSLLVTGEKLACAVGPAGTGKTASMAVVADAWKNQNRQVIGLAPSARAARQLGQDADITAQTLAALTYRWRGIIGDSPRDTSKLGIEINPGDMLLVDEAGMATTADLAALTEIADETGAVIRMVGDPHQLDAVETGGLFRTMVRQSNAVELDTVMRMGADVEQADTSTRLRHGDVTALDLYRQRGWVHGGARQDMIADAVEAHLGDLGAEIDSVVIASRKEDVATANNLIQSELIERGVVRASSSGIALADDARAHLGDTILTRKNDTLPSGRRVLNGERFEVAGLLDDGSLAVKELNGKNKTMVLPADYVREHVQLGYASTVYRAQGITVENARAIVGAETDRRALYVAMTRAKWQNHVYVADDLPFDFDAEQAHWHMSGEDKPDYNDILERIVLRDSGQRSASDQHRELVNKAESTQQRRELFSTAADMLHTDYRREVVEPAVIRALGELPATMTNGLDHDQAVERISTSIQRLNQAGVNGLRELSFATDGLEGAEDVGAVIQHRLEQQRPEATPELVVLPPRHDSDDGQLYDWAEAARIDLAEDKPRQLRPVDPPLPESGEIRGRDLRFADLRGVEIDRLKFVDCDLSGAVFDDADIHRTMFEDCDLSSTSWRNVGIGVGDSPFAVNQIVGCELTGADFTKAQVRNLRLVNSTADKTQFGLAELAGLHLERTALTNTDWSGADIKSATVVDCQLDATVPEELATVAGELNAQREKRAEASRRAHYAGGVNIWPQEQDNSNMVVDDVDNAPEL